MSLRGAKRRRNPLCSAGGQPPALSRSNNLQTVLARQVRELGVRLGLIPVGDRLNEDSSSLGTKEVQNVDSRAMFRTMGTIFKSLETEFLVSMLPSIKSHSADSIVAASL
jgi:hypothetical protein